MAPGFTDLPEDDGYDSEEELDFSGMLGFELQNKL